MTETYLEAPMDSIVTRFIEHDDHVDIEKCFCGIWAVTRCSSVLAGRKEYMADNNKKENKRLQEEERHERKKAYWKRKYNEKKDDKKNNFPLKNGVGKYSKYGITEQDYENMKNVQGGKCAICGKEKLLIVDHDHESGKVRALLCYGCNVGIGQLQDSVGVLQIAIDYLNKYK
jgi:hypothetical protein